MSKRQIVFLAVGLVVVLMLVNMIIYFYTRSKVVYDFKITEMQVALY